MVDGDSLAPGDASVCEWEVRPGEDPITPRACRATRGGSGHPIGQCDDAVIEGWRPDGTIDDGARAIVAGEYLCQCKINVTE